MAAERLIVTDWSQLPLTLRMTHIAAIYDLHIKTVRNKVERHAIDIPQPAFIRPYRWRRDDVRAHFEAQRVAVQRREIARQRLRPAS